MKAKQFIVLSSAGQSHFIPRLSTIIFIIMTIRSIFVINNNHHQ